MPKVATTDATTDATIPNQPAPALVLTHKQSPLSRAVDATLNALTGGGTKPQIATDANGNEYVKRVSMTHGEQWFRIAGEAVHGAFAGLAAGKGAGNEFKGGEAGWEAGSKDAETQAQKAKDMSAEARQHNLDNANYQMLQMNKTEQAWKFARLQKEAAQHDVDFANAQIDRLVKTEGGTIIGNAAHAADIGNIIKVNPDVMADMIKKHKVEIWPHFDADGNPAGITAIMMPNGHRTEMLPAGAVFHTFDPIKGEYLEHHASDPMTAGQRDDLDSGAAAASLKFQNDKAEQALREAQAKNANSEADTRNAEEPGKEAQTRAQAAQERAGAVRDYAEAAKDTEEVKTQKGKEAQANDPQLVDSIGTGHIAPERMAYLLSRNPQLVDAVTAKYPDFDSSKAQSYTRVYNEFTDTKANTAGGALNAGATAMEHLKRLQELNTPMSHVYGTPAYNKYHNQLDTLAPELAKFYGDTTIPAIEALKSTLGATLPGNRQAAIETQAQSMGKKFDNYEQQWRNAAPSANYEAPMPGISEAAMDARAALDPQYRARRVREIQPAAPTPAATNPQALRAQAAQAGVPSTATAVAHDSQGRVVGYQDATGYHALPGK